ncbi:DNA polymerase Y family protein [Parafrankia sp. FMc2]|uniref:DNA polymerase Y family protein n=1 Tax=Parafrankia sp. FMc2 TaxID=3233196 RepID=UPI0034D3E2E3
MALSALQQIAALPAERAGRGGERILPALPALARVLPSGGLRRGTTVGVSGSSSLLLTLLAAPSQAGSWCGLVGVRSLGMLAAVEAGVVPGRLAVVADPVDLSTALEFDPPAEQVEQAAFAARQLAEQTHEQLRERGLACTRIVIEAETEHGERRRRVWRHDGPLSVTGITDRIRWQLDGWLNGTARDPGPPATATTRGDRPTSGLVLVRLTPEGLLPGDGRQLELWGEPGAASGRVDRALTRIQGLLGPDAVTTPVVEGGRDPGRRVRLVPWGEPREPVEVTGPASPRVAGGAPDARGRRGAGPEEALPWPGAVPAPAPATMHDEPLPVLVLDESGEPVGVSGRCAVTAVPAWLSVGGAAPTRITGWAGPWPVDERWWDPSGRRRARFQMVAADGTASLLFVEIGRWWLEATYD